MHIRNSTTNNLRDVPIFGHYGPGLVENAATALAAGRRIVSKVVRNSRPEALLLGGALLFFVLTLSAFLLSMPTGNVVATNNITAPAPVVAASGVRPPEVTIAMNGLVVLRSARVLGIDGDTLQVSTAWGSTDFTWVVHTDASSYETRTFGTRFLDREGEKISLSHIRVGDLITVNGTLDAASEVPMLHADVVRSLKE